MKYVILIACMASLANWPSAAYGAKEVMVAQMRLHQPPPAAFAACEGKTVGSPASFVGRDGTTVSGTCESVNGRLAVRPDHAPGRGRPDRNAQPIEAAKACAGKTVGATVQYLNRHGEAVIGVCEDDHGTMVFKPVVRRR